MAMATHHIDIISVVRNSIVNPTPVGRHIGVDRVSIRPGATESPAHNTCKETKKYTFKYLI